jgi:ABC-type multidrug transport system ATPase subunit
MIAIEKVSVRFGKTRAVDDLSLAIEKGESILLAGANGAGKTSLLRILAGVLRADHGSVRYDGKKADHRSRRKIAYIPASISLYDGMTVTDARPFLRPLRIVGHQRIDFSPSPKNRDHVQRRKNHLLSLARPGRPARISFYR